MNANESLEKTEWRDKIRASIDVSKVAQRNWDLTRSISDEDLNTLIYAASNSPTKQMETHYALHVLTHPAKVREIYDHTKKFTLFPNDATDFSQVESDMFSEGSEGEFVQNDDYSVKNSQILSNAMFVYCEDMGVPRGGTHYMAQKEGASPHVKSLYEEQVDFSIGISVGQLLLSAAMMGYKTGICSALESQEIGEHLPRDKDGLVYNPKLVIGIGYENIGVDRTFHQETYNRDIPHENRRSGPLDEKFRFPKFEGKLTDGKNSRVYINGVLQ